MTFEEKCSFAIQELESAKIWKSNYNPPIVKLIHRLGFQVPFPHYNSFLSNALFIGSFFGLVWGLLMYFLIWREQNISLVTFATAVIFAGTFFGISMALYYWYGFKKYNLTPWVEIK
jgi:hypothetical protein